MNKPDSESILKGFTLRQDLCDEQVLFKIDSEGHWFYQGSPLPTKFARLFCSILYFQERQYFLITPVEKVKVEVEQEPIKIVDYKVLENGQVQMTTSLETISTIDSIEALHIYEDKITCRIERDLTASLNRACYYRYIEEFICSRDT